MIKENELRIGNLVYCPIMDGINKNDIYKVKVIFNDAVKIDIGLDAIQQLSLNGIKGSDVKPIELTEEWLIKFGFEIEDEYLTLQINDVIDIVWVGYLSLNIEGNIVFLSQYELKYVHQLQNLYFALTGSELQYVA